MLWIFREVYVLVPHILSKDLLLQELKNLRQKVPFRFLPWHSLSIYLYLCVQCGRPGFDPWVGKIPWRRQWHPTPVLLPGQSHGWRSLVGWSPWGRWGSDTTERLHFHFHYFIWRMILPRDTYTAKFCAGLQSEVCTRTGNGSIVWFYLSEHGF